MIDARENDAKGNARKAERPKEISIEIGRLENAIASASLAAVDIGKRLETVMSDEHPPDAETAGTTPDEEDLCPLADTIRSLHRQVSALSASIASYTERLEI